jgi:CubicO group peptidase (beta-lactamase class C family)
MPNTKDSFIPHSTGPFVGLVILQIFVLSFAAAPMAAQGGAIRKQADNCLTTLVSREGPGAVVLIGKGDRVVYRGARGFANIELRVSMAAGDTFRIASVTKMFTATMVLKLAEQGKLSLDDPLSKYIVDFPKGEQITIRMLLNHTSGVSDKAQEFVPGLSKREVDTSIQVSEIEKRKSDFTPGTRWAYSNAGFVLLGAVIEKITGKRWYEAINDQLLSPLRLDHTMNGDSKRLIVGRVAGYTKNPKNLRTENSNFISSSFPAAAGGLVSNADDLFRWMQDFAKGRAVKGESVRLMVSPTPKLPGSHQNYDYGLGTFLWNVRGYTLIGHTGDIDGFSSAVGYVPESDLTIVVLANDDTFDARGALRRFTALALGSPYIEGPKVEVTDVQMRQMNGSYRVDSGTNLELVTRSGRLLAQQGDGRLTEIVMTNDGSLHFVPDELTYLIPLRDRSGAVVGLNMFLDGDGPSKYLPRAIEGPQ